MPWKNRPIPQLISIAMWGLFITSSLVGTLGWIIGWFIDLGSYSALFESLRIYLLLSAVALFLLLVTIIEKPNEVLTAFVIICDALVLFAIITSLFIEDNIKIQILCGGMPVFLLVIVLSYPKTAHYMMDKYREAVRAAEQKNIA